VGHEQAAVGVGVRSERLPSARPKRGYNEEEELAT
jgi:hypothetical protein